MLLALLVAGLAGSEATPPVGIGRADFIDRRDPPPWRALPAGAREQFDLGLLIFNTPWVVAGTPGGARRDGLGPLFVSSSCDACHNNGARGREPAREGGLSNSFVMQLEGAEHLYGAVLNTAALPDHSPEGQVQVSWTLRYGHYADGTPWTLRAPTYQLHKLLYGPPPAATVLRPRIAPPVFGAGLLESVRDVDLHRFRDGQPRAVRGAVAQGRFGWQAEARDIAEQTARAFAREMGITTDLLPADDCTATQKACRGSPQGGMPEASGEFMQALVTLQRDMAVPAGTPLAPAVESSGRALFQRIGCASCHIEHLPVAIDGQAARIAVYSDLLLHDLGEALADRRADGRTVRSRWRTAPLWGLAHALKNDGIALLHDGRAASLEEAILWHGGQADAERENFLRLPAGERRQLIEWVGSR